MGLEDLNGALRSQTGPIFDWKGATVATKSAAYTLTFASPVIQRLTFSGGNQDVNLPAVSTAQEGGYFWIQNAGASNSGVVKNSAGSTLATLAPGDFGLFQVSGGAFVAALLSQAGTSVTTGALSATTGAFSSTVSVAGALTSTSTMTTTDGVVSGNARIVGGNVHTKQSSTTLTSSNTETTLATHTLPANTLKAGTSVRVRGAVRVTGNAGADTLTIKLRLGGTAILTTAAAALVANDVFYVDFVISSRAVPSASSSVQASGFATVSVAGTHSIKSYVVAPANYATNGALDVDLRGTWSASSASDIAICETFVVDVVA